MAHNHVAIVPESESFQGGISTAGEQEFCSTSDVLSTAINSINILYNVFKNSTIPGMNPFSQQDLVYSTIQPLKF